MTFSWKCARIAGVVLGLVTFLTLAAPAADEKKPAKRIPLEGTEKAPPEKTDPFVVPKGTPEELLKYIEGLKKERPTANTREAVMEFRKGLAGALLEASDKILAGKPDAGQAKSAVRYKMVALNLQEQFGNTEARKKLEALPGELEKAGLKDLVQEVRRMLLQDRLRRAPGMSKNELTKLLEEVKKNLADGPLDRSALGLAVNAAMTAEYSDHNDLAITAYADFGKLLAKSADKQITETGAMLEGAARRLGLIGKKMELEGTTVAGKPFDWNKYKGKVVLVDFWATWCGPCRAEMPNVEKNYEAYHDRGFDVVGISIDEDRAALEEYLEKNKHPWTVLHEDPKTRGTPKSMSTYYGVFGVPTMMLVGTDGKVVSLNARGGELGKELEKLLGPADKGEKDKGKKDNGKKG